jgi:hypothetical protein
MVENEYEYENEERVASIFRSNTFFRNVGLYKIYTAPHPRRRHSSEKN